MRLNTDLIEIRRRQLGLKKGELADRLEMTRQGLHYILYNRKTSIENITKIADVLDVEPKDLLV